MYTKKMVYCRNKYKQWLRKLFFQISSLNEYLVDKVTKMSWFDYLQYVQPRRIIFKRFKDFYLEM